MKKADLTTPCFIIDKAKLIDNLKILKSVSDETGCKILAAQKAFSMYSLYPLMAEYLSGTTASGLYEAKLGKEEFGGETHVYSPAYRPDEIDEIISVCDHIVFNTPEQLKKYKEKAIKAGKSVCLRINPECSTQKGHEIYDPCRPGSRLGTRSEELNEDILSDVEGFHFHTLCEQNSDDLKTTCDAVEEKFGKYLYNLKYINFGGGHHITREDYNIDLLKECILHYKNKYDLEIYLEPGEAVALNAGTLLTTVLETMKNGIDIAIPDTSAACHMPDVIEMPYRPPLKDSGQPNEKKYTYRLCGPTCLSGDIIGDYSFDKPLKVGQRLEFLDMAIYTMVKTNTFNGMKLPDIVVENEDGDCEIIKKFGYEDFKMRLS